jgi:hypothetical protein
MALPARAMTTSSPAIARSMSVESWVIASSTSTVSVASTNRSV